MISKLDETETQRIRRCAGPGPTFRVNLIFRRTSAGLRGIHFHESALSAEAAGDGAGMTAPTIRNASARRQLQVGDLQFDVLIAGSSRLVLLLHGFPESSRSWRAQVQALAEAGYTAVAPDLRGCGGSSKPSRVEDYALT
jgi:pimeloyl-ACP methyl ester carboxylesterase